MIFMFLKNKKALRRVPNEDKDTAHQVPKWQDIEVLEAVEAALSPLSQFTDMCASKYVTISALKPILYRLKKEELAVGEEDLPLTASIKNNVMNYLEEKYASEDKQQLMNVTCFLDPRYKTDFFSDTEEHEGADDVDVSEFDAVKETLFKDAVFLKMPKPDGTTAEQSDHLPPPTKKAKKTLGSLTSMRKIKPSPSPARSPRDRVVSEIDEYLKFPTIDGDDDPLQWWKFHKKDFPLRRYLAIPASSAPTERLFSKAGQIVTAKRVQLNPNKANMLVFLAENL